MSMAVKVSNQSKYGLPWFAANVKKQSFYGLSMHLIGVLRPVKVNRLRLFTITDNSATVANLVIEYIHRLLN